MFIRKIQCGMRSQAWPWSSNSNPLPVPDKTSDLGLLSSTSLISLSSLWLWDTDLSFRKIKCQWKDHSLQRQNIEAHNDDTNLPVTFCLGPETKVPTDSRNTVQRMFVVLSCWGSKSLFVSPGLADCCCVLPPSTINPHVNNGWVFRCISPAAQCCAMGRLWSECFYMLYSYIIHMVPQRGRAYSLLL